MEEKERYEVISPNLNGYAYIHDFKTDNVLNTYDSCDLLNQQDKRIKELEEELDDAKRDYIPKLEFGLQRANKMGRDAEKEIQQLKQQLAEKDKEIEYYKKQAKKLNNEAQKYFEDAYCNDSIYQDKISFCIEQLEKVKEHNDNLVCDDEDYYNYITAFIDNQIKQLKGKAERS